MPRCTSVATDGTIWTLWRRDGGGRTYVPLDPLTGAELSGLRFDVGSDCTNGLHLLPDDRAAAIGFATGRLTVYDLASGEAVWTFEPATEVLSAELLLVSADGSRLYVLVDADGSGPDLRVLALDAADGSVVDEVSLPGGLPRFGSSDHAYVDTDGGVILATADAATSGDDGHLVRVVDAGGTLSVDWARFASEDSTTDGLSTYPVQLLPGGTDASLVVGSYKYGRGLFALDLASGENVWEVGRPPGAAVEMDSRLVSDASGNVLHPYIFPREAGDGTVAWDVAGPDGVFRGLGPAGLDSLSEIAAIGPDGSVYGIGTVDDALVAFAVSPGEATGPGALTFAPPTVGAAWSTFELRGGGAGVLSAARLRRGEEIVTAEAVVPGARTDRGFATFALTDEDVGEWQLVVDGPDGSSDLGPVVVEPADAEKDFSVDVAAGSVRVGRPRTVAVTVRNETNVDANALPVVVAIEDVPDGTTVQPLTPGPPPPIPEDAPPDFSWDDVQLTHLVDGKLYFPVLVPVLGPGESTTISFRLTIPPGGDAEGTGRITARVADCLLTNDRQVPAWVEDLELDGFAKEGFDVGSCLSATLPAIFGGAVGGLPIPAADFGPLAGPIAGCLVSYFFGLPGILADASGDSWAPLAWDLVSLVAGCAPLLFGVSGIGLAVGVGVAVLAGALFSCGGIEAIADFLFGASVDPNDVVGPTGATDARYLTGREPLGYTIRFENDAGATFPAAEVTVTHTLDADLDPATFRPGPVGWGDVVVDPPPGAAEWAERFTPEGAEFAVDIAVTREDRDVTWRLSTVDPATGQPPEDPEVGFLPPNMAAPEGEGFVRFTVEAPGGVADGTIVDARASIVFDVNEPIVTNTWTNTFDLTPPASTVAAPGSPSATNALTFDLGGSDDVSGIAGWRLEVATGDAELVTVDARRADPSFALTAPRGQRVRLRARAVDGAGNLDPDGAVAEVDVAGDALERIAGPDRIRTAVELSRHVGSAGTVVLARADTYPDALAGAPLAVALGAPILLTDRDALPAVVAEEVARLGATTALLLGGEQAVGPAVAQALASAGVTVSRVADGSRFATARAIAEQLPPTSRAFLVEGANADPARGWPDALAVAPWAATAGVPVLLATRDALPAETVDAIDALGIEEVTVVGGPGAVGAGVTAALAELGVAVDRIAGPDRYATAAAVADAAAAAGAGGRGVTWLATGLNFPDALAAGPAVAASRGQLLLVDGQQVAGSQAVLDRIAATQSGIAVLRLVGGTGAISAELEAAVRAALVAEPDALAGHGSEPAGRARALTRLHEGVAARALPRRARAPLRRGQHTAGQRL